MNKLDVKNFSDKKLRQEIIKGRAETGVSNFDAYNFDHFLINIIIEGLTRLAIEGDSYPEPFESFEFWSSHLLKLANQFKELLSWEDNHYDYEPEEFEQATRRAFCALSQIVWGLWS